MAQPAPKKADGTPTANVTVTITNGSPSSASVTIPSEGVVAFVADNNDYLLELWDKKNENHPAMNLYLGANATIYLVGGSGGGSPNSVFYYKIEALAALAAEEPAGEEQGLGSGGGNKIIIGSGADD